MQELAESPQSDATYSLVTSTEYVENLEVVQYGLRQVHIDEFGILTQTTLKAISDQKDIVIKLINIFLEEDIDPIHLKDVVEDYIAETFGI